MATYPTFDQVEAADRMQLCRWHRFLKSPGMCDVGLDTFDETLERELVIMERIQERLKKAGGFTPAISKAIGW